MLMTHIWLCLRRTQVRGA